MLDVAALRNRSDENNNKIKQKKQTNEHNVLMGLCHGVKDIL